MAVRTETTDPIKAAMGTNTQIAKPDPTLAALLSQVSSIGNDMNILKSTQAYKGPTSEPNELLLRSLWTQVYLSIINQIYAKGLAFWNNKPKNLEMELELAVIRADEAIEAYIRTRNVTPDPVEVAQARWARQQLNKAL